MTADGIRRVSDSTSDAAYFSHGKGMHMNIQYWLTMHASELSVFQSS
jgi:hypothetical protein